MKCLSKLEALPLLLPLLIHVDVHHHHQHRDHQHHHQLAMSAYTITSAQSANRSDSAKSQSARVREGGREVERSLNFTRFPDRLAVHVASQNDTFNAYLTCRYIRLRMQLPPLSASVPLWLCPSPLSTSLLRLQLKDASGSESELTPLIVTLRVTHARTRMHTHAQTHVANLSAIVSTHKCIRATFVESLLECVPSVLV